MYVNVCNGNVLYYTDTVHIPAQFKSLLSSEK